jgi:uncharacterized protein
MAAPTHDLDLGRLRLTSGEGRRFDLAVPVAPFAFGAEEYAVSPEPVPVRLDVSRTTGEGFALRLRFAARLAGPCMRCLADAAPETAVDAREVDQPGEGEELESPYLESGVLDLAQWTRDALALALPVQVVCREDCGGLCPECGERLDDLPADHEHARAPDPRWAKLRELGGSA